MCGLPDCGGRGGEIFRTIKPSPLALPLNFVSCVLSGNRAGGGGGCLWAVYVAICLLPHRNVRATRLRWERRGNFPDYEALTPGPPPEFCIVCFVRQPGRGRGGCLWAERCTICSNPHRNVRATRPRWERRENFPDYEVLSPGPPPEFCIVCFVRQPGRGRVVDVCGQNAVRFVPTRTGMCGLRGRGGRGGGRKLGLNIHPEGSSRNLPDEKTPIPERARRCLGMGISAHHFFDAL